LGRSPTQSDLEVLMNFILSTDPDDGDIEDNDTLNLGKKK
jgi:hypothetical protein